MPTATFSCGEAKNYNFGKGIVKFTERISKKEACGSRYCQFRVWVETTLDTAWWEEAGLKEKLHNIWKQNEAIVITLRLLWLFMKKKQKQQLAEKEIHHWPHLPPLCMQSCLLLTC